MVTTDALALPWVPYAAFYATRCRHKHLVVVPVQPAW